MQFIHGGRQNNVDGASGVAPLARSVVPFDIFDAFWCSDERSHKDFSDLGPAAACLAGTRAATTV
jgi:hypothetical protein